MYIMDYGKVLYSVEIALFYFLRQNENAIRYAFSAVWFLIKEGALHLSFVF